MISSIILERLKEYNCDSRDSYEGALKEIIQEIALLGLWRAKFFEKAAFYGGTALRILYGLDRFSEDLDFSLLAVDNNFSLDKYNNSILRELESLGFSVSVESKEKKNPTPIRSAFIKSNTKELFIRIGVEKTDQKKLHSNAVVKIKLEVDTQPPLKFEKETKLIPFLGPFSITTMSLPDLFAGKMHALLFRDFSGWVKGRDWYDFTWFLSKQTPVSLVHLKERMIQLGHLDRDIKLSIDDIKELYIERVKNLDIASAQNDVKRFLKDPWKIQQWSHEYFYSCWDLLKFKE